MNYSTIPGATEVAPLPEEGIIEDSDAAPDRETSEPAVVRTAAFLAEEHTSTFLLAPTVQSLIARQEIQHAIVDPSTEAGVGVALELIQSGVTYDLFDSVSPENMDKVPPAVVFGCRSFVPFNAADIAAIDANIVLMPVAAIDAGPGVDVSDGTIAGAVISQLQQAHLDCLLVLPPESGLRRQDDGSYVRLTLKLAE